MTKNNDKKVWSQPTVTSVERLKNAAGGTHSTIAKGSMPAEYLYNGPGS